MTSTCFVYETFFFFLDKKFGFNIVSRKMQLITECFTVIWCNFFKSSIDNLTVFLILSHFYDTLSANSEGDGIYGRTLNYTKVDLKKIYYLKYELKKEY